MLIAQIAQNDLFVQTFPTEEHRRAQKFMVVIDPETGIYHLQTLALSRVIRNIANLRQGL